MEISRISRVKVGCRLNVTNKGYHCKSGIPMGIPLNNFRVSKNYIYFESKKYEPKTTQYLRNMNLLNY